MISTDSALALRAAGLVWHPVSGDRFQLNEPEFEADVFTVSEMTIEPREYSTGKILSFNGTTEWALDSVALDDALWLPREDQLRDLLGASFRSLERVEATETLDDVSLPVAAYRVVTVVDGAPREIEATDAADAYARALIVLLDSIAD